MDREARFQKEIREHGWGEFKGEVILKIRVGGEFLGWASNDVITTINEVLPKKGIMVDDCRIALEGIELAET